MKVRINEYNLESQKLNNEKDILVVSDIHSNSQILKIIKEILTKNIKYILIPGDTIDYVDHPENNNLFNEIKLLSQYAKIIISLGNHDIVKMKEMGFNKKEIYSNDLSFFEELNKLDNCIVMTDSINNYNIDEEISVNSINMPLDWYQLGEEKEEFDILISKLSSTLDNDKFNILLSHTPNPIINHNILDNSKEGIKNINLILSGHNHGGLTPMFIQNISKNHIGIFGPYAKIIQPNAYGYWTTDDTSLILSNGITKIRSYSELLSIISSTVNKIFMPELELIHMIPSKQHSLQLKKRTVQNINIK